MGLEALSFAVDVLITTCCMYIASKMSFVSADFKSLALIAFIVSIVALIPSVGGALSLISFVFLLTKATHSSVGDCVWVVLFTKVISLLFVLLIGSALY